MEGTEFVKEPIKFSSERATGFGRTFDDLSPWSRKGAFMLCTFSHINSIFLHIVYHLLASYDVNRHVQVMIIILFPLYLDLGKDMPDL